MSLVKYRVRDLAKDFGLTAKDIVDILEKYTAAPKSQTQTLTDQELSIIFEYITLNNQVEDVFAALESTRLSAPKVPKKPKPEPAPVPEPVKPAEPTKPAEAAAPTEKTPDAPAKPEAKSAPQPQQKPKAKEQKPAGHKFEQTLKPTIDLVSKDELKDRHKHVDTRTTNVDLSKYDERVDKLVPDKAKNINYGKEKIKRSPDRRQQQGQSFGQKKRQEEQERMRKLQLEIAKKQPLKVLIPDEINVGELALRLKKTASDVIKQLMKLGVMASISESVDFDTASLVALEFGAKVTKEVIVTIEDRLIDDSEDKDEHLETRSPVVVVMGHVDHGKTSLLDAIKNTNVVSGEAGGITQHIGAYRVKVKDKHLTFLDTPGHAAFTSMRARGAQVTDIAILVVAADDGIMPQTIEAINHAKAAEIPIIVAVNKMDREGADPDKIISQLTEYELISEEWGGDTIICKISAKTGQGIDNLLEMLLLTAEMRDLKANPNRSAKGTVIEAKLDKGLGPMATVLVQNGTLNLGDVIIAGKTVGRVRVLTDDKGAKVENAGPSVPVSIVGLSEVPDVGDLFYAVEDERMARELGEQRKFEEKQLLNKDVGKVSLEDLFEQIQQGNLKDLNIIVKADVGGSAEAIKASLEKLTNEEVRVRVIHSGVGAISESDIMLASASAAIVVGFNVRPDSATRDAAARVNVDIRTYSVIYECIEEMEAALKGMLAPKYKEVVLGHAEIRQTYKVSKVGVIAGCYVTDGKIVRNSGVRVLRDGIVMFTGELASLKRFKDDVKEVATGYECGLSVDKYNDISEKDVIEAFIMEEVKQ